MSLARLLGPRRRFSLWRVFGPGTWIRIAVYTALLTLVVGVYRSPALLDSLQSAGSVGGFVSLVFGVVPLVLVPVIFVVVAVVVVALRLVREAKRSLGLGRRRRGGRYTDYGAYDDGRRHELEGGLLGGGLLGGGLLGGGLLGGFDGDDDGSGFFGGGFGGGGGGDGGGDDGGDE